MRRDNFELILLINISILCGFYKKIKPLFYGIIYGAEYILRNDILYVSLNNGVYRYYINEDILRYTANSWYDDINTDNL